MAEVMAHVEGTVGTSAGLHALADESGAFTRMLGLEINPPASGAPFSQRYMGLVQDGILTRLVRSRART
jgi:peroxiredoxin